jgi:prepilin-type N-terminal cleavage/methylation domain-containing protein
MKNKNLSDSGFSIVEIMVAMGILGVLSYGVMKLMDNSNKVSKDIQTKDEIFQLQTEILKTLHRYFHLQTGPLHLEPLHSDLLLH